jgi:hypothetical protein
MKISLMKLLIYAGFFDLIFSLDYSEIWVKSYFEVLWMEMTLRRTAVCLASA